MRFLAVLFFTVILANSLQAQGPVDIAADRASQLIDSTMSAVNLRAERFNEEIAKVNALKALDVPAFAKDTIKRNKEKIKDFLEYLEVYRSITNKLIDAVEDSVKELRQMMPRNERADFLKDFEDAYQLDQKAFTDYTLALTKVFTGVKKILDFMEDADIKLEGKKILFTKKAESEEYSKLIEAVELSQKKLATAGANSQKARIDASMKMQKAYGKLGK
jgi:DNA integrity scanning protein DisA with diadenylate cyclase activity